jgi:hypothetical protein
MSKIQGALYVTNKDWKYVYNSVLNFFNDEIVIAYTKACDFYEKNQQTPFNQLNTFLNEFTEENKLNDYQLHFIKSALFSGSNNKLYKPKKNNFKRINNRTEFLNAGAFTINFDKKEKSINFETNSFDDLDNFIRTNNFISEFITMVNTIDWPTRPGPNKTIKGCTLINMLKSSDAKIFYKVGPNPPTFENIQIVTDTTIEEPKQLQPEFIKNISMVSSTKEETHQPVPTITPEMSEF